MKLFVGGVATLGVVWGGLYLSESPGPGEYSLVDRILVHEIAFAFTLAAVVMIISRKSWTFRAVGLFLTSVGTAILYGLSSFLADGGSLSPGVREAWLDLARGGLGLGGLMVIIGLILYLFGWFSYRDDIMEESRIENKVYEGEDRRGDVPGRREVDLARYKVSQQLEEMRGD